MQRNRLEAFSDGVLAILITIMVLELKVPHGTELHDILPLFPVFLSYTLSFIYIGIYWSNHHHLLHTVNKVSGGILWSNLYLLFWLSLLPFVTAWIGENQLDVLPAILYNFVLMMAAIAYYILTLNIIKQDSEKSLLLKAIGSDFKGKISIVIYFAAILAAFYKPWLSILISIIVALYWLIPDKRIEKIIE